MEEQYKKPKDAETKGKEPTMQSISEWPLYLFTNSPPEELADDGSWVDRLIVRFVCGVASLASLVLPRHPCVH